MNYTSQLCTTDRPAEVTLCCIFQVRRSWYLQEAGNLPHLRGCNSPLYNTCKKPRAGSLRHSLTQWCGHQQPSKQAVSVSLDFSATCLNGNYWRHLHITERKSDVPWELIKTASQSQQPTQRSCKMQFACVTRSAIVLKQPFSQSIPHRSLYPQNNKAERQKNPLCLGEKEGYGKEQPAFFMTFL